MHNLHYTNLKYLLQLLCDNPDYFLDEMLHLLKKICFISVHYTTVHHKIKQVGMSVKKLKLISQERNVEHRAAFIEKVAQYMPEQLGFVDEVSKDERTPSCHSGRSKKGGWAEKKQPFV
jgi:hypothetical protein